MNMSLMKSLYIIAIGLLVAAFIGFGADAFYTAPKEPEFPTESQYKTPQELSTADKEKQKEYDKKQKVFRKEMSEYNQNLSIILIGFAVLILAASILGLSKLELIGDGATLGGVFTLFYGIGRAVASEEAKFRFIAITVALVIILFLSYWKFLKGISLLPHTSKKTN